MISEHTEKRRGWWWKVLLGGAALWIVTVVVTSTSQNSNLIPTIILLGSFLIPFTVMMYAAERVRGSLTPIRLMLAFTIGGMLGVIGATILEGFLQPMLYISAWVAIQWTGIDEQIPYGFILRESAEQAADIQATAYWLGLTLISVIGILVLWRFARASRVVEGASRVG